MTPEHEIKILIVLSINFLISLIIATFADKRENGFANAFFNSFLLTPIGGILFIVKSKKNL
jgi:hypothetical protein